MAAGALALAAFLSLAGLAAAQMPPAQMPPAKKTTGGNKALMEDWVRKKQALRDQVYEDLRRKGLIPENGVVSFEAWVKPDPNNPGKVQVRLESQSIVVRPRNQAPKSPQSEDPIFGPRVPNNGLTESVEGSIPIGGGAVRETITIIGGKPQEQGKP